MKQQDVIDLLIEKTKSGEMIWDNRGYLPYSDITEYYGFYETHNYWFRDSISQVLLYSMSKTVIVKSMRTLRKLHKEIKKQQKEIYNDNINGIYHDILTG